MDELTDNEFQEMIKYMTYEEKREALLNESRETGVRPMILQKKYGISINPGSSIGTRNKVWNDMANMILKDGADKYLQELFKLKGTDYLKHYEVILQYFKPRAPQQLNINIERTFEIGFENDERTIIDIEEDNDGLRIEEE